MDSLTHFHSRNVYFYIHYNNSLKVKALDMFKKNWVHTPLKVDSKSNLLNQLNNDYYNMKRLTGMSYLTNGSIPRPIPKKEAYCCFKRGF